MRLEQQRYALVGLGDMADFGQHRRQGISIVAGTCAQHHANAVSLILGILVQTARHHLRAIADQVLQDLVLILQLAAEDATQSGNSLRFLQQLEVMFTQHMANFMP